MRCKKPLFRLCTKIGPSLHGGCGVVSWWLWGGFMVVVGWFHGGCEVVSWWLWSGCDGVFVIAVVVVLDLCEL